MLDGVNAESSRSRSPGASGFLGVGARLATMIDCVRVDHKFEAPIAINVGAALRAFYSKAFKMW